MAVTVQSIVSSGQASRQRSVTFPGTYVPAAGDIIVMFAANTASATINAAANTNWVNPLGASTVVASGTNTLAVAYHVVTSGEASAVTLVYSSSTLWMSNATAGNTCGIALRGVDSSVVDSFNSTFSASAVTPHALPGLTGTDLSTNSLVLSCVTKDGTGTYTTPAGWTQQVTSNTNQGTWVGSFNTLTTAGNNVAATNITPSASDEYASVTLAFAETVVAGPTGTGSGFRQFLAGLPFPPPARDAGLNTPFLYAAEATGATRNIVTAHGAVANNSAVDVRTALAAAVAAASNGDTIYIPNGNYYFKGTANGVTISKNLTISGESETGVVFHTMFGAESHSVFYVNSGLSDLIFEDFSIVKDSGSNFLSGIRFFNEDLAAATPVIQRAICRNLNIQHHQRYGIQFNNTKHGLVDNCTISNAVALDGNGSGYGVLINGPAANNNWVRNCDIGPVIRHGVVIVNAAHHNLVGGLGTPNDIHHCVSGMVDIHGEQEPSNEVSYNTIHDEVLNGTTVSANGAGVEIGEPPSGDTALGGSGHDKSGPYNWVHHNEIYNCPQGVRIMNKSDYEYVEDNDIHDCDDGVLIDQQSGYTNTGVNYPTIKRNTIDSCITGVNLIDIVVGASVQDNTITNCTTGIVGDANTTKYLIRGNTMSGNGADVALTSSDGTYIP